MFNVSFQCFGTLISEELVSDNTTHCIQDLNYPLTKNAMALPYPNLTSCLHWLGFVGAQNCLLTRFNYNGRHESKTNTSSFG